MFFAFIEGAVKEAMKATDVSQGTGLTIVTASSGALVFIEGHPVLISAIGMLLGLSIQALSIAISAYNRDRIRRGRWITELRKEAALKNITIDELLKDREI